MRSHSGKNSKNQSKAAANRFSGNNSNSTIAAKFADNRPFAIAQRQLLEPVQRLGGPEEEELLQGKFDPVQRLGGPEEEELLQGKFEPIQRKENNTGMPDHLKSGIESLSGIDMGDVQVHHNSPQPAQLNALAYAQGTDIHIAPGQEKHLAHEAWHVAQQKQGRVQPTMSLNGQNINDDTGLEQEADIMGEKAQNTSKNEPD